MTTDSRMNARELKSSLSLALIFFLRMFGLFLILPVFAIYAETLKDATPLLVGVALGIYGLTQALFQIPFGVLSDRFGRKTVITIGLVIFIFGSVLAGSSDSIILIILGRALQGAGAIAAAIMALASDLTRDSQRSKAMAIIGISIGIAFMLSFIAGPILGPLIGVPGLFYLGALLALVAIAVLYILVPNADETARENKNINIRASLVLISTDKRMLFLFASIFTLHMLLMAVFVVLPLLLRDVTGITPSDHWQIYLPVLILSGIVMIPCLILGEKYGRVNQFFALAILLMMIAHLFFYQWHNSALQIGFGMLLFFLSFNYLEACLPSLVSQIAPPEYKGAALGMYSTSQFIGTFIGGVMGGILHEYFSISSVFLYAICMTGIWLCGLIWLRNPMKYKSLH